MTQCGPLRPAWTPLTITLMILGFVFYWPLGLAMIAYILWGDHLHKAFGGVRDDFRDGVRSMRTEFGRTEFGMGGGRTGNGAFDEYRDSELERLEDERRRLDEMRAEFDDFLANLRHARDREEFDQFMSKRRNRGGAEPSAAM
ncbi:uncharacterized protein DUF2852 [Breoghania corrubedonensis]|uniref:Uncharacterized protein DUF2852 n=1 Tax=Breoghania corrubedonensis TaxID=665038 RepID=A0A2T5VH83_9HYPH|nr:DUF2852 domain-containing protein [Breoghania corrubedonensis]PTW63107.1 uncharacterized protein DUF2852 [Breoghania corrubedonensis]